MLFNSIFNNFSGYRRMVHGAKYLVNDVSVSHYRLSFHLVIAILIISIIFWLIKIPNLKIIKVFLSSLFLICLFRYV